MRRWIAFLFAALLAVSYILPAPAAHASDTSPHIEKGLLIAPVQQYLSGDAGTTVSSQLSVSNLTNKPLTVSVSVKQFSVTDYTYNYTFAAPDNDWLRLSMTTVTLQPNRSADIPYTIQIPPKSAPGGRYYTLLASATLPSAGVILQAADLVYLTVNGKLITVSKLQDSSIHWLSFGRSIPFTLQPVNTGNVYSFVYVSSQLHGLFVRPPVTSKAHLLMPGKVRSISDSIPSPVLPGVYLATYGYKTNDSSWVIQKEHVVVYIPPWFLAFLLAALLVAGKLWGRKKRLNTDGTPADPDDAEELPSGHD